MDKKRIEISVCGMAFPAQSHGIADYFEIICVHSAHQHLIQFNIEYCVCVRVFGCVRAT